MLSLINYTVCIHIFNALLASREELEVEKEDEPRSNGNDRRRPHGKRRIFYGFAPLCSQARLAYPRGLPALLSQFRRLYCNANVPSFSVYCNANVPSFSVYGETRVKPSLPLIILVGGGFQVIKRCTISYLVTGSISLTVITFTFFARPHFVVVIYWFCSFSSCA